MLRRLYDYIIDLASRPRALWVLAAVSFAETVGVALRASGS